jgi:hypothetical protein
MTHHDGWIAKAGMRGLRYAMMNAANHAMEHHHRWKKELERLEPPLGQSKAIVAIVGKLLVAVFNSLTKQLSDRFADPEDLAHSFMVYAY